jgi:hypothetical protein
MTYTPSIDAQQRQGFAPPPRLARLSKIIREACAVRRKGVTVKCVFDS